MATSAITCLVQSTDEYGFIVLCVNSGSYGNKCNYPLGFATIADNPGNVDVAIVKGTVPSTTNEIVDIYGVPGEPTFSYQSFVNGRVNRKRDTPNPTFDFTNWVIMPGGIPANIVPSSGADPGCWNGIGDCSAPPAILDLIITEIADPYDGQQNRFVEIYSPTKRNYKIVEDLQLVRYEGSSSVPASYPSYPLTGLTINEFGFIVFCVNKANFGNKCDYELGNGSIADNPGDVDVAIVEGTDPNNPGAIVDIYGLPGQFTQQNQLYTGGRCVRIRGPQSSTWIISDWFIFTQPNLIPFAQTDPGCWKNMGQDIGQCSNNAPPPSPPSPPTSPPNSSPGKGKGKGKGKDKGEAKPGNKLRKVRRLRRP
uniref:LTD domain-containing protein n=1 Tax=Chaetoceros debilis TaxID=122233 RepID=A0A7S3QCQ7_9STRA